MQTLRKKTSPCKHKYDPGRFFGDGVVFKAKLIGILEVGEARGDRMCQEALQDLKIAIRAAGEHKQRITINVTIDGLRLRDERTGDSLYHHPVHKISFIAQDMTDSRAFGYIFGSPDSGHRFFGIKTDKAASQVVLAMRDLFQVVFELKKKEIELARQHIQSKAIHDHQPVPLSIKNNSMDLSHLLMYSKTNNTENLLSSKYATAKEMSPESVADLVDLEQELSSIQRGITQMERITPSEPPNKNSTEDDPFGDSFTQFPTYNLLPPPESSKSRQAKQQKSEEVTPHASTIETNSVETSTKAKTRSVKEDDWLHSSVATKTIGSNPINNIEAKIASSTIETKPTFATENVLVDDSVALQTPLAPPPTITQFVDAFSDLDPLGTGKFRPYIDKKYFFQDLKNPPKKVLKDLTDRDGGFSVSFSGGGAGNSGVGEFTQFQDNSSFDTIPRQLADAELRRASDANEEFNAQFAADTQIFSPNNNGTHGTPPSLARAPSNVFATTFHGTPQCVGEPNITSSKPEKTDEANANYAQYLVMDNDPFSPRAKKYDVFEDDFSKKSINAFDFSFNKNSKPATDLRNNNDESSRAGGDRKANETAMLNGSKYESSSKRHGSDSMSESEIAPDPPPRPETNMPSDPPPLPPKKQLSEFQVKRPDIVIRPRIVSPLNANREMPKYDYLGEMSHGSSKHSYYDMQPDDNPPSLPLPSRRIGRSSPNTSGMVQYPGPGRPEKKRDDDYLTPITSKAEMPVLLPPPKGSIKNRPRRSDSTTPNLTDTGKISPRPTDDSSQLNYTSHVQGSNMRRSPLPGIIPDITLSQLLTLGIDDLALKLNVPSSKLNTMTIVELTKYLSDFIERSSQSIVPIAKETTQLNMSTSTQPLASIRADSNLSMMQSSAPPLKSATESSAVFKVSFDDSNDATFIAKFDDNFGIDNEFIPNFAHFNQNVSSQEAIDKYAVFREIIDQDMKSENKSSFETQPSAGSNGGSSDAESSMNEIVENVPHNMATKIDTKITEAISHAKDRYAALRDIILVENLFEKPISRPKLQLDMHDKTNVIEIDNAESSLNDDIEKEGFEDAEHSSPDVNISITLEDPDGDLDPDTDPLKTLTTPTITQPILSNKDDLEIDEYMNRAISNLSLDSRDHLSPLSRAQNASTSPLQMQNKKTSPIIGIEEESEQSERNVSPINRPIIGQKSMLNDMSTSPIPLRMSIDSINSKSPTFLLAGDDKSIGQLEATPTKPLSENPSEPLVPAESVINSQKIDEESWAVFESDKTSKPKDLPDLKPAREGGAKAAVAESPYSSDDKADWKTESKKWNRGHTSSSSRDLSPWDDEGAEYRKRTISSHPDRHGFYMRHARRMNSCDDEYEYEDRRRDRRPMSKSSMNRSRDNFDSESWHQRTWSPEDDGRSFERCSYERSTYGPPYEKRDLKSLPYTYDRYVYKGAYDKRKYYQYGRPYDGDDYEDYENDRMKRKEYMDDMYHDNASNFSGRSGSKMSKEKRSFDRDSTESFDSSGRRRKSFGSGNVDMYNSLDYKGRYSSTERKRGVRKANKNPRPNGKEYEQDSDGEESTHRTPDTRSLQRRPRKNSGSSPSAFNFDVNSTGQRAWARPASASESERKLAETRKLNQAFSGSDGEKDRRFFRKPRSRDRENDSMRSNYGSMRYPSASRGDDYEYEPGEYDEDDDVQYRDCRSRRDRAPYNDRRKLEHGRNMENMHRMSRSNRDVYQNDKYGQFESTDRQTKGSSRSLSRREQDFNYESYEDTPHPNSSSNKFDFEPNDQGFESDFTSAPEKSLRFSTNFTEDKTPTMRLSTNQQLPTSIPITAVSSDKQTSPAPLPPHPPPPPQQQSQQQSQQPQQSQQQQQQPHQQQQQTPKLRFDDKITVSKFDLFEDDDFSQAEFSFENEDQWVEELPRKINLKNVTSIKRGHENIKKSESINIFARNNDDPFEDDDFFKTS